MEVHEAQLIVGAQIQLAFKNGCAYLVRYSTKNLVVVFKVKFVGMEQLLMIHIIALHVQMVE